MVAIVTHGAGPALTSQSLSENTYWLQAIALKHLTFLETFCLKVESKAMYTTKSLEVEVAAAIISQTGPPSPPQCAC